MTSTETTRSSFRTLVLFVGLSFAVVPDEAFAVPAGYSSEILQVKFRDGTEVDSPKALLPRDLARRVADIAPLFSLSSDVLDRIRARGEARSDQTLPDLKLWFRIKLEPETDADSVLKELSRLENVEIAEPAPLPAPPPAITPDLTASQGYLGSSPGGIDADYAWNLAGGNGSGITIYDIEYSWNQTHEDLSKAQGNPLLLPPGDSAVDPFNDNNHGTAVLGELVADNDGKGVTGIAWGADIRMVPAKTANLGYNPANAILLAVADGSPGDVILIEQQVIVCGVAEGPLEWNPAVFMVIKTAVGNGFVVVEAAGNGDVDLDASDCYGSFDTSLYDSGAINVGAGGGRRRPPRARALGLLFVRLSSRRAGMGRCGHDGGLWHGRWPTLCGSG